MHSCSSISNSAILFLSVRIGSLSSFLAILVSVLLDYKVFKLLIDGPYLDLLADVFKAPLELPEIYYDD